MSKPTAEQRRRWNKIAELGCLPCLLDGTEGTPATISHSHEHGYRDHDKVWPCCPIHHLYEHAKTGTPNRHANPIEFRDKYGTDSELVEKANQLLEGRK
jgi:hypothetical protein